jgi:hypothetical protein
MSDATRDIYQDHTCQLTVSSTDKAYCKLCGAWFQRGKFHGKYGWGIGGERTVSKDELAKRR